MALGVFKDLAGLYLHLHEEATVCPRWKAFSPGVHRVVWKPFGIWEHTGYTDTKLNMLIKRYVPDFSALEQCRERVRKGMSRKEVSSVAINLGHNGGEASPLRYQMGQCLSTIVFRLQPDKGVRPLVIWRTVEITRRWIADLVFLHRVFNYVLDGYTLGSVDMMFNVVWFADFNVALAGKWIPWLEAMTPDKLKKRFVIRPGKQQYRARDISWTLAKKARHIFDHQRKTPIFKNDFSLGEWGGKVKVR